MKMNREMRRASIKNGKSLMKKGWNEFEDIMDEVLFRNIHKPHGLTKAYRNNFYVVQIFSNVERKGEFYTKVMIRRNDESPIHSWSDMFRIKNELLGEEIEAVTFLPKKSELIDEANLYWFFIKERELK
jgi:hypothetical protein